MLLKVFNPLVQLVCPNSASTEYTDSLHHMHDFELKNTHQSSLSRKQILWWYGAMMQLWFLSLCRLFDHGDSGMRPPLSQTVSAWEYAKAECFAAGLEGRTTHSMPWKHSPFLRLACSVVRLRNYLK